MYKSVCAHVSACVNGYRINVAPFRMAALDCIQSIDMHSPLNAPFFSTAPITISPHPLFHTHTPTHTPTHPRVQRPFAYSHGSFNLALEAFGQQAHDDMLEVAKLWSDDDKSFIPAYLASSTPAAAESTAASEQPAAAKA